MKTKSIKKNFIYQMFYEVLILLIPLATSPYLSRVLGAANIGTYSYTYTVANYFVLFAALGIKNYGNREISRSRDDPQKLSRTYTGILFLHFLISGIVAASYLAYVLFVVSEKYRLYAIIQSAYVIGAFFDISWFFFGMEEFRVTVTRNSLIKILSAVLIFVLVKKQSQLWLYCLILAVTNLASQLYLWLLVRRYVHICRISSRDIFCHLPQMLLLFIPTVAISLYNYMDKVMLGAMSNETQLGFYENSEKITFIASSVIGSLGTVMLPRMSNVIGNNKQDLARQYINESMEMVMCLACAMTFGLIAVADVFAPVFWGEEFTYCSLLIILLASVLPVKGFANVLRTQYLIPNKRDKEYTFSVCVGAILNFIFNIIFIRKFQAVGACIGTIIAEVGVCLVQAFYCVRELPLGLYIRKSVVFLLFGTIMAVSVRMVRHFMGDGLLALLVMILCGVVVYGILCIIYFIKTKNRIFDNVVVKRIKNCVRF